MSSTHACAENPDLVNLFPKPILILIGIALLIATLFLQTGHAQSVALQITTTPTPDRLTQPTLPAAPSQADYGAQEFWSRCLPCHGDRGQGLTDEFRETYPPEDRNCWLSGCHGARPYPDGWTIPAFVPPVIGPQALQRFQNAQALHDYICAAMPFQWPGTLEEDTCWKLTAFLLRQNGLWEANAELNEINAAQVATLKLSPSPTPVLTVVTDRKSDLIALTATILTAIALGLLFIFINRGKSRQ